MMTTTLERPAAEPLRVDADPEMSGQSHCRGCNHTRQSHGSGGCVFMEVNGQRCSCKTTYMDLRAR